MIWSEKPVSDLKVRSKGPGVHRIEKSVLREAFDAGRDAMRREQEQFTKESRVERRLQKSSSAWKCMRSCARNPLFCPCGNHVWPHGQFADLSCLPGVCPEVCRSSMKRLWKWRCAPGWR